MRCSLPCRLFLNYLFMKPSVLHTGLILSLAVLLFSCASIDKRRYMQGYHVEWRDSENKRSISEAEDEPVEIAIQSAGISEAPIYSTEKLVVPVLHSTVVKDSLAEKKKI